MRCVSCGEALAPGVATCRSCGAGRRPKSAADLEAAFNEPPPVVGGPRIGHDFGTRYRVLKRLGMGGMGVVYQALDRDLGVHVALKVLRPVIGSPQASAEMQRRFTSELLLARKITHKNVIRIHDIGEINGIRFISMPFVEGGDLATILTDGPLDLVRTLRYARHLASGLMAVHAAGVIHRDLKPANIMIGERDQPLLMDFGIARSSEPSAPQRTIPGAVIGTAAYMAPEQVRGETTDQRTDIYAFGLILYEMILGTRDISVADLFARLKVPPTSPRQINPQVSEGLDAIVMRCLQPNPANRYQNAVELATAIAAISRGERRRSPVAVIARRWLPRVAIAALVAALAGLAYWASMHGVVSRLARSLMPERAAAQSVGLAPGNPRTSQASTPRPTAAASDAGPVVPTDVGTRTALERTTSARPAPGTNAIRRGDLKGAAREAEQAIKAYPRSPGPYLPLAATAALTAPSTARAPYERMAALGPAGASLAATGLADLALYQGQHAAAVKILEAAIARETRTPDRAGLATKYLALAEARAGQGQRAEAVIAIRHALATSRDERVLLPAARLYVTLHLEDAARPLAAELAAGQANESRAYGGIVDAELALGKGDTTSAIDALLSALKTSDLWLVRLVLGTAYLQAKQYPEALAQLQMCEVRQGEAAALFVDDEPSIRYLGMLKYLLAQAREGAGRTREAAEDLRQFLILRASSPDGIAERDARMRLARIAD